MADGSVRSIIANKRGSMARYFKLTASIVAVALLAAGSASPAQARPFSLTIFLPPGWTSAGNLKSMVKDKKTPEAILAQQIADAIAALPGTPTQAQITAAINTVLATSTASPQVKQTALAVVQASVGPTSPIAQAAGASATTLAANTGAPVVSTSSAAVQTAVNTAVKSEIVTTLAGVSSNLANAGTPSNSDYRPG
jgi:hypothetical protein